MGDPQSLLQVDHAIVSIMVKTGNYDCRGEGSSIALGPPGASNGHEEKNRMDPNTIEAIRGTLRAVEQDRAPLDRTRFAARIHALETIEFQILDRIENIMYVHGYQRDLAALYRRAAQYWQHLTAINEQLFEGLRNDLQASGNPSATLRRQLHTCVSDCARRDPIGYDDLDVFINGILGIDTEPEETRPLKSGMIGYQATPARFILELIERIALGPDDVFYDLGSGLGRVALLVGLLTPTRVRGIEYDPGHCAYAQQCAQRLPVSRVRFTNADVREVDVSDGTVFFMYTPFRGALLQAVLEQLRQRAQQRPVTIATYGPCTLDVAQSAWLESLDTQAPDDRRLAVFRRR